VRTRVVSEAVARDIYGVVMAKGAADEEATHKRRATIRKERLARARPGKEVMGTDAEGPPMEVPEKNGAGGRVSFGELMEFDFGADQIRCLGCKAVLGKACGGDFRLGCVAEAGPVTRAGPGRGEDYDAGRIHLRIFYCPGCGRQLDTQVALRDGHPPSGFRLFGAPEVSAG
jgi:N-methylhydantoinase B